MITTKEIAEKIHMFYNLLYHLDDYIKNKKERKGQLHLSKNIRLVLREVISSKNNLKYFINKEEIDSHFFDLMLSKKSKKQEEIFKNIKIITPLSFNQKNLNTINLFYNSNNETFVLNYIILDKIFSIIRFCFIETLKKRKIEFIRDFENKNSTNFSLHKIDEKEISFFSSDENNLFLTRKNSTIKNILETKKEEDFDTNSTNKGIKKIKSNKAFKEKNIINLTKKNHVSINISSLINNNYNCNNITSSQDIQINEFIRKNSNLLRNLRWQVRIINDRIKLSQIKDKPDKPEKREKNEKNENPFINRIKKQTSFPIIKNNKTILKKSEEKYKKREIEDSTLISENKIEAKNIIANIMKSKKINYPGTTLYSNKIKKQSRSGIFSYYDYRNILPLFKLSKINTNNEN